MCVPATAKYGTVVKHISNSRIIEYNVLNFHMGRRRDENVKWSKDLVLSSQYVRIFTNGNEALHNVSSLSNKTYTEETFTRFCERQTDRK